MAGLRGLHAGSRMEDRDLTITLELRRRRGHPTGRAVNGAGPERKFFGRLGLLAAIELLLGRFRSPTSRRTYGDHRHDPSAADTLRDRLAGAVATPGDPGWDAARQAFNLTIDQRPTAVAYPVDETDVASVVAFARDHGLRIAPQSTGHNAGPIASLQDTVLLKTSAMTGVEIDPAARRARVRAGARWADVADPASEHGLAPLAGSSRDVGVVGYSLGGGMGWLARRHGLAANSVTAIELVTADGRQLRVDARQRARAVLGAARRRRQLRRRHGDGVRSLPAPEVYAGALFFPFERASEVLHAWREWLPAAPEDVTSVGRVLQSRHPPGSRTSCAASRSRSSRPPTWATRPRAPS